MKTLAVRPADLVSSADLGRSSRATQFEERLQASIEQVGLAEPLKVAPLPNRKYLVVDGLMRLNAINEIRVGDPSAFLTVPCYVVDYARRYEIRFQTDIYQDLLPSQLATLVEHLHKTENVRKNEIARYIGVSPATLRNYTGLWRLKVQRGLFARVVELMDAGVIPSSNPYAWLRLTSDGIRLVLELRFAQTDSVEEWIDERIAGAKRGGVAPFPIKYVETATNALPAEYYREASEVRTKKRDLGLRRAAHPGSDSDADAKAAMRHVTNVARRSQEPVLKTAARSLAEYLR